MKEALMAGVEELLHRISSGDLEAEGRLWELLYSEIHKIAHARRVPLHDLGTLQTTALVHETYLKLARSPRREFDTLGAFYVAVARVMRNLLVDEIRRKQSLGREKSFDSSLGRGPEAPGSRDEECLAVDAALEKLERIDPRLAELVTLRYFAGLSVTRVCQALDLSPATYHRRWNYARSWLLREIAEVRIA